MVQCMLIIICINSFTLFRLIYLHDRGIYYTLFIHMLTHISVPTLYFGGAIATKVQSVVLYSAVQASSSGQQTVHRNNVCSS